MFIDYKDIVEAIDLRLSELFFSLILYQLRQLWKMMIYYYKYIPYAIMSAYSGFLNNPGKTR